MAWRRKGLQPLNNTVELRQIYRGIVGLQCPHGKLGMDLQNYKGCFGLSRHFFLTKLVFSGGIFLFFSKKLKSVLVNIFAN